MPRDEFLEDFGLILGPSGAHFSVILGYFFDVVFWYAFGTDFCSFLDRFWGRFWNIFWTFLGRGWFCENCAPAYTGTSIRRVWDPKKSHFFGDFFELFFESRSGHDFWWFWVPFWAPFWSGLANFLVIFFNKILGLFFDAQGLSWTHLGGSLRTP